MNEKKKFPDYVPKQTPDTIEDYLRGPSKVYDTLSKSPKPELENIEELIEILEQCKKEAKDHPGNTGEGNVAIGADPDQYYPSDEELIVSEIGKRIQTIINDNSEDNLREYLKTINLNVKKIEFNEIYFRHVDVMGSGRFFYAEKKTEKTIIDLE